MDHAKQELGQYATILTEQAWDKQRVILCRQDSTVLPTWLANSSARFGSPCPFMELVS